ncbi:MAG TPA: biopolymer transporter ExbD [Spirochaetota bacterium]|nr:biopolymer transporter ExbD [Spirochaetota bacterium]HQO02895.1 biopolymer transporter ExbD [Spirochaetota bacterium]HQP49048.1 biopolymer transporter ExbD [Spirochaetota bacterium]
MDFIRKKRSRPHIEITPLVDIIFLLLVFFMISSNFIEPIIRMDLPKAMSHQKLEKVDLVVTVDQNETIYINKSPVLKKDLQVALQEKMLRLNKFDVIFKADKRISYNTFVEILDISKIAGATSFSVEHTR